MQAAAAGVIMAVVLQSSAAVVLLSASFFASSVLKFSIALAIVFGADLGSALVVQLLSFQLDWLVPLLLAIGGWLFVYNARKTLRQAGLLLLGVALILISLGLLREAVEPVRNSSFLVFTAAYLERDAVAAFLLGAVLTWMMHSSVAMILTCVALVQFGVIPFDAGLYLVLGANLGSAILPIWLGRKFSPSGQRILYANFAVRGSLAIIALAVINYAGFAPARFYENPGTGLIVVHFGFNAMLLLLLPYLGLLERLLCMLIPKRTEEFESPEPSEEISCLDPNALDSPILALASVRREILGMAQCITAMVQPIMDLYRNGDPVSIRKVREMDARLNKALSDIRRYVAALPFERMTKSEKRLARDLTDIAVDLEAAGDIVSKQLTGFAKAVGKKNIRFSDEGWNELSDLYCKVTDNMALAFGTLATDDVGIARHVVEEKAAVRKMERVSRKRHFKRLWKGLDVSFESSDVHLETLRALKEFNARVAAVSYPILVRERQLLDTRLV